MKTRLCSIVRSIENRREELNSEHVLELAIEVEGMRSLPGFDGCLGDIPGGKEAMSWLRLHVNGIEKDLWSVVVKPKAAHLTATVRRLRKARELNRPRQLDLFPAY